MAGSLGLNCPIHPDQRLYKLAYTKLIVKEGKKSGGRFTTKFYYCIKCDMAMEIKIKKIDNKNWE